MTGLSAEVVEKLVRGNAIKMFGLDLPDAPTLAETSHLPDAATLTAR